MRTVMHHESRAQIALATHHLVLAFGALVTCVCLGDLLVTVQVGTEPWSARLFSELALSALAHSLALSGVLLLIWAWMWWVAGPEAGASLRSRGLLAIVLCASTVALDIATWPAVRARGDFTKLRVLLDCLLGLLLVLYVVRPHWFVKRQVPWLCLGILVFGIVGVCLTFGTTMLPVFPKIRRGPIAGILLMHVYFAWTLFVLYWGRPTGRLLRLSAASGLLAFLLAGALPSTSQRASAVIVETLEATRSLRLLHRRLVALPGFAVLPGARTLLGTFPPPLARVGEGLILGGPLKTQKSHGLVRCDLQAAAPKSVLLLSIDSLRADYFDMAASALPNISSLRARSLSFPSTMQACSGTAGSLYAMHTGRYVNAPPPGADPWADLAHERDADYAMLMQGWDGNRATSSAESLSRDVLKVVATSLKERRAFIIHAHYMSVHVPGGFASLQHDYAAALREVDRAVGLVLDRLRMLDVLEQTIVIITGDHGEEDPKLRGYLGHGYGVWDSSVLTPLIVWTGVSEARTAHERVSGTDIFPTMLELLGCSATYPIHGRSLVSTAEERPLYASGYGPNPAVAGLIFGDKHAVSSGRFKMMADRWDNAWALYDLKLDPRETHNIIDARPDIAMQLKPLLEAYLAGEISQ